MSSSLPSTKPCRPNNDVTWDRKVRRFGQTITGEKERFFPSYLPEGEYCPGIVRLATEGTANTFTSILPLADRDEHHVGAATVEITPATPFPLEGQMHARISTPLEGRRGMLLFEGGPIRFKRLTSDLAIHLCHRVVILRAMLEQALHLRPAEYCDLCDLFHSVATMGETRGRH
jgi:hypothetical protein